MTEEAPNISQDEQQPGDLEETERVQGERGFGHGHMVGQEAMDFGPSARRLLGRPRIEESPAPRAEVSRPGGLRTVGQGTGYGERASSRICVALHVDGRPTGRHRRQRSPACHSRLECRVTQTVDTDLLIHASNRDSNRHDQAVGIVDRLAEGPELLVLLWPTLLGYIRIATHPAIFPAPFTHVEATRNVEALLTRPNVRAVGEIDGFWDAYLRVTDDVQPRGNLVPDAHVVALMKQHSLSVIWTSDRDFRKFDGITSRDPFA